MSQVLRTLFTSWQNTTIPQSIPRDYKIRPFHSGEPHLATILTGFRRVGKTTLMLQYIQKLLATTPKDQILYLNLEDERIVIPSTQLLTDLIPTYHTMYGHKPKYIFLDELQVIPLWSKWVRRILDTEPDIQLFITGSTSQMSSAELPTELRGRAWEVRVYPLSFIEFLRFKNTPPVPLDVATTDQLSILHRLFEEYLLYGGLPGVVLTETPNKIPLLQSYFRTVVERDVSERYNLKNNMALPILFKLLLNSPHLTISKLHNDLKSLGVAVGKSTIELYLRHIASSYFYTPVYLWGKSANKALLFPRASYLVDNGFITAISPSHIPNFGRLLKNLVFTNLVRQDSNIYYYKDYHNHEIDFVVENQLKLSAYQVAYDIGSKEVQKRELRSLQSLSKQYDLEAQYLITLTLPPQSTEKKTQIISAINYFLNDKIL